jgi:hypothetical protein
MTIATITCLMRTWRAPGLAMKPPSSAPPCTAPSLLYPLAVSIIREIFVAVVREVSPRQQVLAGVLAIRSPPPRRAIDGDAYGPHVDRDPVHVHTHAVDLLPLHPRDWQGLNRRLLTAALVQVRNLQDMTGIGQREVST